MIEPSPTASKPILMFHVQHFFGMGHLIRALALAEGLSRNFRVILVTGGELPAGIAVPVDLEVIVLPGLGMNLDSQLFSVDPAFSVSETLARRRRNCWTSTTKHSPMWCWWSCSRLGERSSPRN